jgi:ankyrin repeat protein
MEDALQLVLERGEIPYYVQYNDNQTLLHVASRLGSGKVKAVQKLLELGVYVNSLDYRGQTPLHVAERSSEDALLLLVLLDHGADPRIQDDEGQTPLHSASRCGRIKVAQRLLELGVNINSRDNRG